MAPHSVDTDPVATLLQGYALGDETRAFLRQACQMWIGNRWCAANSGATMAVEDPASGVVIATVPAANAHDIDQAVVAARLAFQGADWAAMAPRERARLLMRLADLVEADVDTLSEIETLDNGKPLAESREDILGGVDYLRYVAGWCTKLDGSVRTLSAPGTFAYTRLEAIGVVGAIVPWNFPFSMALWKIGPCLATGCTIVLKPAEQTPLSALRLGQLIARAGYPAGVVNIVTGDGRVAGAALAAHPGINKIAFTGSTAVGRQIGVAAMANMTRMTLELGGKSPVIVFDDADIEAAIAGACNAIFYNQGQVCTAGSRLLVQRASYQRVVEAVAAHADALTLAHGFSSACGMGPLISARQRSSVLAYIDSAEHEGARRLTRRRTVPSDGYFVAPTVFADTNATMRAVREEIFGPVLMCSAFDDEADAVAQANDTQYGLAASIWTRQLDRAHRVSAAIRAGTVWVNNHWIVDPAMPFGGMGQSGIGRELGREQLDAYLEVKSVMMLL